VLLGEDHPHALACSSNLGVDLQGLGDQARGDKIRAEALERMRQTLGTKHPDVLTAADGQRIDIGIEVYATF
jgi:hypothetical protein